MRIKSMILMILSVATCLVAQRVLIDMVIYISYPPENALFVLQPANAILDNWLAEFTITMFIAFISLFLTQFIVKMIPMKPYRMGAYGIILFYWAFFTIRGMAVYPAILEDGTIIALAGALSIGTIFLVREWSDKVPVKKKM